MNRTEPREPKQDIDAETAYRIIEIVDNRGVPEIQNVTADNAVQVLTDGIQYIAQQRHAAIESRMDQDNMRNDPVKFAEWIKTKFSRAHAIQCSVNMRHDLAVLYEMTNRTALEQDVESNNTQLQSVLDVIEADHQAHTILIQLFGVDIVRRIGQKNNDPELFTSFMPRYEAIKQHLTGLVASFREDNPEMLQERPAIEPYLQQIEDFIATATPEQLNGDLYERLVKPIGKIVLAQSMQHVDYVISNLKQLLGN